MGFVGGWPGVGAGVKREEKQALPGGARPAWGVRLCGIWGVRGLLEANEFADGRVVLELLLGDEFGRCFHKRFNCLPTQMLDH